MLQTKGHKQKGHKQKGHKQKGHQQKGHQKNHKQKVTKNHKQKVTKKEVTAAGIKLFPTSFFFYEYKESWETFSKFIHI